MFSSDSSKRNCKQSVWQANASTESRKIIVYCYDDRVMRFVGANAVNCSNLYYTCSCCTKEMTMTVKHNTAEPLRHATSKNFFKVKERQFTVFRL